MAYPHDHTPPEPVPVERGVFDPADPSVARALYAEALHDLLGDHAGTDGYVTGGQMARPEDGFGRFQAHIDHLLVDEGSEVVRNVLGRLRKEPFVALADFDPVLASVVKGTVDPVRHHHRLHLRPRCGERRPRGRSYEVDGSAVEALAAPRVRPCPVCAADLEPVSSWVGRRFRWVRVRNRALTVATELRGGGPSSPEALWSLASVVTRGLGLRTHSAVRLVNEVAAESARRAEIDGSRKGAAFDATVYITLHEASERAGSETEHADLRAMRDVLGGGCALAEVVEEAFESRSRSTLLRGRVRQRIEALWGPILSEADRRYGATRDVPMKAPTHLDGTADGSPLVRRVLATHGLRLAEVRVSLSVEAGGPVPEPVALMLEAAKEATR